MTTQTQPAIPVSLPFTAPSEHNMRLLLYVMRRIAVGGLKDAHGANAMLGTFGLSYRRPLMFLRVFMAELARASSRTISVAPCCCGRMTKHEAELLGILGDARRRPMETHERIARLIGAPDCRAPLSAAIALGDALADMGRGLD